MNRVAVLVVEDMPQVRATAVRVLEEVGYEVYEAYNGQAALEVLDACPEIDILFSDVRLPGMSGPELAYAARRRRPDLRVVLTSGYVGREDVPEDMPFLSKPWRPQDFASAVQMCRP